MKSIKSLIIFILFINSAFAFELTQETIYCHGTINQKLNCNYQLGEGENVFETSVSLAGYAQYLIQSSNGTTTYAKHIIQKGISKLSYQITKSKDGNLSKQYVVYSKPTDNTIRPFFKGLRVAIRNTPEEVKVQVQEIKDIIAKFNSAYQVKAENFSAKN